MYVVSNFNEHQIFTLCL